MGASQSTDHGTTASAELKTSYYELLGLQRQATEDEIKKAYRRKALELHPDRNFGNEATATAVFAEVQAAYEVLSDPQERAWYDSHEAAILRGADDDDDDVGGDDGGPTYENVRATTADDLARMVRKFNSNVEFSDAPSGFFGFLRDAFAGLAREEAIAASWEGTEAPLDYPSFGHQDDAYDDVVKRFYAAWAGFATVKSFAWRDRYRLSEAPDRWSRRRMEQENRKLRQDGVREFNDAVRALVAFVRKRDPRYVPSTQTEAERQKALRDAAAAQAARARAANEAKWHQEVPEWTKVRDPEELEESSEEEVEVQILECVACNKEFKSERQWEAHEKSKKHQKALYALQKKMRKENANLDLDERAGSGAVTPVADVDEESESPDVVPLSAEEIHPEEQEASARADGDAHGRGADEGNAGQAKEETASPPHRPSVQDESSAAESDEDDEYGSAEHVRARLQNASIHDAPQPADSDDSDEDRPASVQPKMGKAAQKRAKRAAAAAASSSQQSESSHACATCNASFPSKTQLHQHIKDHGHAVLKPVGAAGSTKGKKKGKR